MGTRATARRCTAPTRSSGFVAVLLVALPLLVPRAAFAAYQDISAFVQVTQGNLLYDRHNRLFVSNLSVTNTSATPIAGRLRAVITSSNIPLSNTFGPPDGLAADGKPYYNLVTDPNAQLAPGASTSNVRINFQIRRLRLVYTVRIENEPPAPANNPPSADAGRDNTAYIGDTVTLDGSASTDLDGDPLTYAWTLITRPAGSTATLTNPNSIHPTFLADQHGSYVAQLIVNDGSADSTPDTVSINSRNTPPVADAGPDQSVAVGATVTLDAGASSDAEGDPLTYTWTLLSKPAGSAAALSDPHAINPTFVADRPGSYAVLLDVSDGISLSLGDTVTVTTRNSPPVADAGPDQSVFLGDTVTLDASASTDVDGDPLGFRWALLSKPAGSAATLANPSSIRPTFTVDQPGAYVAQLIVNDGTVDSAPDTVTVSTRNSPPTADAGPDQSVFVGDLVTLDAGASSDPDGDPLSYAWSLTAAPPGSAATLSDPGAINPDFTVDRPGGYVAQLIVNDGTADSAPDTVRIDTKNSRPVADAGPDQAVVVGNTVTLDASASHDADGDPLSYLWSLTAAPPGSAATLAGANTVSASLIPDLPGVYVAQLIVRDGLLASTPDTLTVTVVAPNHAPSIDSPPPTTAEVGRPYVYRVQASDPDGDTLTFALLNAPAGMGIGPASGRIDWTPASPGTFTVSVQARDGRGATALQTFQVTVTEPDLTPPVITIETPPAGLLTDQAAQTLSGVVSEAATVTLDGVALSLDANRRFTQALTLQEGVNHLLLVAVDPAGNRAEQTLTVTLDTTPPAPPDATRIARGNPRTGLIPLAAQPGAVEADVRVEVRNLRDGATVTLLADAMGAFSAQAPGYSDDTLSLVAIDTLGRRSPVTLLAPPAGQNLTIAPLSDRTVPLGTTVRFTVTASAPGDAEVVLSATPLPLPAGMLFDLATGEVTFKPVAPGVHTITFLARTSAETVARTVTLTVPVPDATAPTTLAGRILDANRLAAGEVVPIAGVTVSFLDTASTTSSDADGRFTLTLPAGHGLRAVLEFNPDTATAPDPSVTPYARFREQVTLIAHAGNRIERPVSLPRLARESMTQVLPGTTTTVSNPSLGVTLSVAPDSARNADGTPYTGELSISLVPPGRAPAQLPEFLDPGLLITVQPVGVTFTTPAPITFPNVDNLPPGSVIDIWSLDSERGIFAVVGRGRVSADGRRIETVSGGVRAADWQFGSPPPPSPPQAASLSTPVNPGMAPACIGSRVCLSDGRLEVRIDLPAYRSLGRARAPALIYQSTRAAPYPLLPFETSEAPGNAIPLTLSADLRVAGLQAVPETFLDPRNLGGGERRRASLAFDARDLPSGLHAYTLMARNNYLQSRIGAPSAGEVLVVNAIHSAYGAGWLLEGVWSAVRNPTGSVTLIDPGGRHLSYVPDGAGGFVAPPGEFSTLAEPPGGGYLWRAKDGTERRFDAAGRQQSLAGRNGNTTTYAYDSEGRLTAVTDPSGARTELDYVNGFLAAVADPAGRTTAFTHDAEGNLTRVIFPDGATRRFAYDGRHLLTAHSDERGATTRYEFGAAARLARAVLPDGTVRASASQNAAGLAEPSATFATPSNPAPLLAPEAAVARFTDGRGALRRTRVDAASRPLETTDALGRTTVIERDSQGNPLRTTRPNGTAVIRTFDARGNPLSATEQANGATTTASYDAFGLPTALTDPLGHTTVIERDARGNPVRLTDPLGHVTTLDYDARGLLIRTEDPNGLVTTLGYNARGLVATRTETPPVGEGAARTTTFEYDAAGNLTATTTPDGLTVSRAYDPRGRLVEVSDPAGERLRIERDPRGNPVTIEVLAPDGTPVRTETRLYDARNRLVETRAPHQPGSGSVTTRTLDPEGHLIALTDPRGAVSRFSYDAAGRMLATTDAAGGLTTYAYDANDRVTAIRAPDGATTTYAYDPLGRRLSETSPDRGTLAFGYDANDRLTTVTDARGLTATRRYDALDRVTAVIYPDATRDLAFGYDTCPNGTGRLCTVNDPSGTTTFAYDGFGNLASTAHGEHGVVYTTTYGYDARDRPRHLGYPAGRSVERQRDALGRLTAITTTVNGHAVRVLTGATYRADGRLATRTFGNGLVETRSYDLQGRLTEQRLDSGDGHGYAYDANGNPVTRTVHQGFAGGAATVDTPTAYAYDPLERLVAETPPAPAPAITYTHDPNGNRTARTTGARTESDRYRERSNRLMLRAEFAPGTAVPEPARDYGYDDAGRLTTLALDGRPVATYTYDYRGLRSQKTVHHPDGTTASVLYHYDRGGRLLEETRPDGTPIRDYLWQDDLPLAQIDYTAAGERLLYLHPDALATPRFATDETQTVVWRREGDAFGATAPDEDPDGDGLATVINLRFPGQYFDAESGLFYNWHRYYDPRTGRYITSDPIGLVGGINTYAYVNANPLIFIDREGRVIVNIAGAVFGLIAGGTGGAITGSAGGGLSGGGAWRSGWSSSWCSRRRYQPCCIECYWTRSRKCCSKSSWPSSWERFCWTQ